MKMKMKISSKLLNLIKQSNSFIIAGHINPEGDSIGSCLALALGLKKMGKKNICVVSKDPVPENLKFLPSSATIKHKPPHRAYDLAVLVDCNGIERTGFESFNAKKTAIIDHHVLTAEAALSEFHKSVSASLIQNCSGSMCGELFWINVWRTVLDHCVENCSESMCGELFWINVCRTVLDQCVENCSG